MANLPHDVVNNLVSSLSSVLVRPTENIEKELYATAFKNSEIQNCIVSSLVNKATNKFTNTHLPTLRIFQKLTSAQQLQLQDAYLMFNLDFERAYDSSPHAFARASRKCERKYLLHFLKITPSSVPVNGYDVVVKDVGGKPILAMNDGCVNHHVCFPLLDNADDYRHSMFHHTLRTTNPSKLKPEQLKVYNKFLKNDVNMICYRKSQNCTVKSQSLMFLHSTYDMTPTEIANSMESANAIIAAGCFIFNPDVLINDHGQIPQLECYYKKFLQKVGNKKKLYIRFWFENDYQDAYTHSYETYVSFLYSRRIAVGKSSYFFQPLEVKNSIFFFSVTRSIYSTVPITKAVTVMTIPSLQDKLVLYYYRWETLIAHFCEMKSLVPIRLIVPKRFFDNLYSYAISLPEGKFTVKTIITAGMTFNTREIINGMTVTDSHRLSPDVVCYTAHVVYFLVYVSQYEMSRTTSLLIDQENKVRKFRTKPFYMRYFSNFFQSFKPHSNAAHVPINEINETCNDTRGIRSVVEKLYDHITRSAHPERAYSIFVSDYSCKFITIEQECGYLTSNRSLSSINRGHFDHTIGEIFDQEKIIEALSATLPVVDTPVLKLSPFVTVDCGENLELIPNRSNGLCFFQSLIDAGMFKGTIAGMKQMLLDSTEIQSFSKTVVDIVESDTPPDCYATEDVMKLTCHVFDISLCLHTSDGFVTYGTGTKYHLHVRDNHCQALVENFINSPVIIHDIVSEEVVAATPDVVHPTFEGFYTNIILNYYRIEESFSRTKFKTKYSTARRTIDGCHDYIDRTFRDRTSLQFCELFSLVLSGKQYATSFMASSSYGSKWYDYCLNSVKYFFSLDDNPIDLSTVCQIVPLWGQNFTPQHIIQNLTALNVSKVSLYIADLTFVQPYTITEHLDVISDFNESFVSQVECAVAITHETGDAVFLVPFYFSSLFFSQIEILKSNFSDVRLFRLLSARTDSFDIAIVCTNRCQVVVTSILESYFDVVESLCGQFDYCSRVFSQHIHNAGTHFEESVIHPVALNRYFMNLLDSALPVTPVVNCRTRTIAPIGDIVSSSGNVTTNTSPSSYIRKCIGRVPMSSVCVRKKTVTYSDPDQNMVNVQTDKLSIKGFKNKVIASIASTLNLSTYTTDRCSDWDDVPLGITTPAPLTINIDRPHAVMRLDDDSTTVEVPVQDTVTNETAVSNDIVNYLTRAADEYLRYLKTTIECDLSLVRTFYERVIERAVFSNDAVTSFPSNFFLYSDQAKTIAGVYHSFTHYYNSKFEVCRFTTCSEFDTPFQIQGLPDFVIVNEYCSYGFLSDELTNLSNHDIDLTTVQIDMLQAGPGTGKTTYIINNHTVCTQPSPSTVILSTREGRDDFRRRVRSKFHIQSDQLLAKFYRTAASYLLNHSKNIRTDTLYIDEALMHHAGAIAYIISLSGCKQVTLIGDKNQIPFVNRTPDFRCEFSSIANVIPTTKHLNISFRCPLDIIYRIHDQYPEDIFSANKIYNSVYYKKISSASDVPINFKVQYLVFTQSEKAVFEALKVRVATVHEFQGKEADTVFLVRLNPYAQEEIFNNATYVLVALTRHKKSCVYYTRVPSDLVSKTIKVDRVLCHEINTRHELDKQHRIVVGDYSILEPTAPSSYISIPHISKLYVNKTRATRRLIDVKTIHITSSECKCALQHFKIPHDLGSLRSLRHYFRNNVNKFGHILVAKYHIIDNADFCNIMSDFLYFFFYKTLKTLGLYFFDTSVVGIHTNVFNNLSVNASLMSETHVIVPSHMSYECCVNEFSNVYCYAPPVDFVTTAQGILNERFGSSTLQIKDLDEYIVMTSDLTFGTGSYRFTKLPGMMTHSKYGTMQPNLKTVVYNNRNLNYREILLALEKRNFSAPKLAGVVDYEALSTHMVDNMFAHCIDMGKFNAAMATPILFCQSAVAKWLDGQKPNVCNQIVPDFPLHLDSIDTYNFSIKRKPKPSLDVDAASSYAALQTILYHSKSVNSVFCSIFKQIKSKLIASLSSNCFIYADMSPNQLADMLTARIGDSTTPFSIFSGDDSIIFDGINFTEVDISKYDKSQNLLALLIDIKMLRKFQVPEYFVQLWFNCHFLTYIYDRNIKLRACIPFQRKSGDASTFLFNTTFAMCVIANEVPLSNLYAFDLSEFRKKNISIFPLLYNLEVKIFSFKYAYFCSKFLFFSQIHSRFFFLPDPLKLLVKFGRSDLVNEQHVECYRISVADNISSGYSDFSVAQDLSCAVNERYNLTGFSPNFIASIVDCASSKAKFSSLFYADAAQPVNEKITYFSPDYFYKE
ncbi:ORF1 [Indomegoura indica nege-like virus 1]|nr:ORF1 [Indomegoura indica nege-like virus 1]